jgi:hypothetical protein
MSAQQYELTRGSCGCNTVTGAVCDLHSGVIGSVAPRALTGRRRCGIPEHRRQIRTMQRWCAYLQLQQGVMWQQVQDARKETSDLRQRKVDYRSVCQCWSCRMREWWRFRNGETYPSRVGWRFPWVRREKRHG